MTTDREAMQMALEALEMLAKWEHPASNITTKTGRIYPQRIAAGAADALRAALSRKALDELAEIDRELGLDYMRPDLAKVGEVGVWGKREWQGLTEEEIALICGECAASAHQHDDISFARAIEAKLKEKNK